MRILINGTLYDSSKTPVLLVFDDNEKKMFGDLNRFVSAPPETNVYEKQKLIEMDIDNFKDRSDNKRGTGMGW